MVIYHNHKEYLAYLTTAGYFAAVTSLIADNKNKPDFGITIIWTLGGVLAFLFVVFQLYNRWIATNMIDIFTILAARQLKEPLSSEKLEPISLLKGEFPTAFKEEVDKRESLKINLDPTIKPSPLRKIAKWIKVSTWPDRIHLLGMSLYGILGLLRILC